MSAHKKILNSPAIRRMPSYLHWLLQMRRAGERTISTKDLADYMRIGWIVVRKDIALTGVKGRPHVGYEIDSLIRAIRVYLGWQKPHVATLFGAGALGSAILGYDEFADFGLEISSVFDAAPEKVGTVVHGHVVRALGEMEETFRAAPPEIGILCVPAASAQAAADALVGHGVRFLWNFASVTLSVPDSVIVQQEVIAGGFAVLSAKIKGARRGAVRVEE